MIRTPLMDPEEQLLSASERMVVDIANEPAAAAKVATTNWKSIYIIAIVTFITMLEVAVSNDWNYFCQLDSSATITFYGILRTVGGFSGAVSTVLAGWLCNKLRDTRQVLVLSKVLILLSVCFFMGAELVHGVAFYTFFLLYKLLTGIATGGGNMGRTHVAMASTEADRAKAINLCALLPAIGLLCGFLINVVTSFMKYPGWEVPVIGIHLNLFTAPMLFSMLIFLVALYLLVFHFDGKWHNFKEDGEQKCLTSSSSTTSSNSSGSNAWTDPVEQHSQPIGSRLKAAFADWLGGCQFDWVGVSVCLFTQLVVSLSMLNLLTINMPYQQLAFQWSAAELQFFGGLGGAAVAVQLILWPIVYMVFGLNRIISERISVIFSLSILLIGYLFTYNWPFLAETMPYAHNINNNNNPSLLSTAVTNTTSSVASTSCGGQAEPGCPSHYLWCATTTKPNMVVYMTAHILTTGMALPIMRMNLDILYSKMLGNIKQGVMQGLFMVGQLGLDMAGAPIAISWMFERTGPKYIWQFIGSQLAVCLLLWLIFYKRMISNTERLAQKEKRQLGLTIQQNNNNKCAISPSV